MKRLIRCLALLALENMLCAQSAEQLIRRELQRQVDCWNRGDIKGFMEGYEDSPETLFVGKTITRGHAQVLANYIQRYPSKQHMGTTTFSDIEVRMLGSDYATVLGRWKLERPRENGGPTGGIFTLIFRKTAKGWKIIQDHTS
jgi:ketosteroid isomerase-like protein